ncbi:MAG: hypothetical protein IRZ31_00070 [Thermogemmatispora sp.]|uniref:hypothetical protein n=1 Tax=Thermogemmatispora sp. TaxID=1968838 RepID=UPI0026375511|nr:hypothetical protein [Thermogemmatispora sp.]MBX5455267.1 hypothetical protein [Thermogemmatispora sp.]
MVSSSLAEPRTFVGRGLSPMKRAVTIVALLAITLAVLLIALHEGLSAVGSTIAALLFIAGFIYYLWIIAPQPFTITVSAEEIVKRSQRGETVVLRWEELARVKEEFFPNGTRISLALYRRPSADGQGEHSGQPVRAWVVYRDDVDDLDGLAALIQQLKPADCRWESATVHE